jgi:hypothetical protein
LEGEQKIGQECILKFSKFDEKQKIPGPGRWMNFKQNKNSETTTRHVMIDWLTIHEIEETLTSNQRNKINYKEKMIRKMTDFSSEIIKFRKQWYNIICTERKKRNYQFTIFDQSKYPKD